jgi:hypothetical protein
MIIRKPARRGGAHLKIDLKYVGCEDVDWIHLAEDRNRWPAFMNMVMNLQIR